MKSHRRRYASVKEMQDALLAEAMKESQAKPEWNSFCEVLQTDGILSCCPEHMSQEWFTLSLFDFFLASRAKVIQ